MRVHHYVLLLALIMVPGAVSGANYYLSAGGNDAVAQPTAQQPWKSISKINGLNLEPGDSVLFKGGDTLSGTVTIGSDDNGSAASPVVIGSFGSGHAVIKSTSDGLDASNCSYIRLARLDFAGPTRLSGGQRGVYFNTVQNSIIDSVRAQGYNRAGIDVNASQHIRLTACYATDNGYVGIHATGSTRDLYIGYCKAINNPGYPASPGHSGNGILLESSPKNCTIEYCEAAENGWDMGNPNGGNGPGGIWTWMVDTVLIQYCIAHNNRSTKNHGDGLGFDWDGGTNNTTIQYCYSYENDGAGYFYCENSSSSSTNNICRYNISENDGNLSDMAGIYVSGANQRKARIYNNIIYTTGVRRGATDHFGVVQTLNHFSGGLNSRCVWFSDFDTTVGIFYNNIFIMDCKYGAERIVSNMKGDVFRNNLYWSINGIPRWTGYDAQGNYKEYRSLDDWRTGTGNEKINGRNVGMYADPLLVNAGNGEKLTDPTKLPQLFSYILRPTSPCINAGLDLRTLGINPGARDFYGRPIPCDGAFDIGACEYDGQPVGIARRFLDLKNGADLDGGAMRRALAVRGVAANTPLSPTARLFDCAGKIRSRVYPVSGMMVTGPSYR
jgi:hypothetical protein